MLNEQAYELIVTPGWAGPPKVHIWGSLEQDLFIGWKLFLFYNQQ